MLRNHQFGRCDKGPFLVKSVYICMLTDLLFHIIQVTDMLYMDEQSLLCKSATKI